MKKKIAVALFLLLGSIIGYFYGKFADESGWNLIFEVINGTLLFWVFGIVFWEVKDYGIFIGATIGLFTSFSVDWFAGSDLDISNKLSVMLLGSFIGWAFWRYRKLVFVGGIIGGMIGFVWGLKESHWFGTVCVPPGMLNASLLAIHLSILGMGLVSFLKVGDLADKPVT